MKIVGLPLVAIFLGPISETTFFEKKMFKRKQKKFPTGQVLEFNLQSKNLVVKKYCSQNIVLTPTDQEIPQNDLAIMATVPYSF